MIKSPPRERGAFFCGHLSRTMCFVSCAKTAYACRMVVTYGKSKYPTLWWIGERPSVPLLSGPHRIRRIDFEPRESFAPSTTPYCAAVEYFKPTGPSSIYGLLGAMFHPEPESGSLQLQIAVTPSVGMYWHESTIVPAYVKPQVGLGPEYADVVERYLLHEGSILGSGILTVDMACVDEVASSPFAFAILSGRLIASLQVAGKQIPESNLEAATLESAKRMRGK